MEETRSPRASLLEYKGKKFLIFDAPNDKNLPLYLEVQGCKQLNA